MPMSIIGTFRLYKHGNTIPAYLQNGSGCRNVYPMLDLGSGSLLLYKDTRLTYDQC